MVAPLPVVMLPVCSSVVWEQVVVGLVLALGQELPRVGVQGMVGGQRMVLDQVVVAVHDWCSAQEGVGQAQRGTVVEVCSVPQGVVVVGLVEGWVLVLALLQALP